MRAGSTHLHSLLDLRLSELLAEPAEESTGGGALE